MKNKVYKCVGSEAHARDYKVGDVYVCYGIGSEYVVIHAFVDGVSYHYDMLSTVKGDGRWYYVTKAGKVVHTTLAAEVAHAQAVADFVRGKR